MQKSLIFSLLLVLLIVVFALQNSEQINIQLFFWPINSSIALITILSILFGAILGILFSLPSIRKKSKTIAELNKELKGEKDSTD